MICVDDSAPDLADIEALGKAALATIPAELRRYLGDVVIRVEDFPSDEVMADMGLQSPFYILGLYHGVNLKNKSILATPTQPDMIFLYRRPLLDYWCGSGHSLRRVVRHVLIHEVGHHFGFSDADMEAIDRAAE